jgi:hypothetical protein
MQFPLRDFFWLSLVIGLTIGIAIEHKRVRDLTVYQGQAEWWEKAARELGEKLAQKSGNELHIQGDTISFSHPDPNHFGPVVDVVRLGSVRDTREPNMSLFTGLIDLDVFLMMLVFGGPILAIYYLRQRKPLPPRVWDAHAPIWKHPWQALMIIASHGCMSIFAYSALRSSFTGTLFLFGSVIWTYYYCQHILGKPVLVVAQS